jgi:hypothetical protein
VTLVSPGLLVRATAIGVIAGILAFAAGLGVVGLFVPEKEQHGAVETVFNVLVFTACGAAAYAVARRRGSSIAAASMACVVAIGAMGVLILGTYVAIVELLFGGDGIGPDN